MLTAGVDYPKNFSDFERWFSTEEKCYEYIAKLKWPEGFICPHCESASGWKMTRGRVRCGKCRKESSVTVGTLFQDTHKPLRVWLAAMWHITNQKNGTSALGLQRALGFGSYATAWLWMHKFRRAMVRPGRDKLSGRIEIDETFIGGEASGKRGRGSLKKTLVVIAVQENGKGIGRIRLERALDASAASLTKFILHAVEEGSIIHTDGWRGYAGLRKLGYEHQVSILSDGGPEASTELLPRVHLIASLIKRWILGTHQGSVSPEHLDYYLDEFTFRFNRRTSKSRGLLFHRLVEQCVNSSPVEGNSIYGGKLTLLPPAVGVGGVK